MLSAHGWYSWNVYLPRPCTYCGDPYVLCGSGTPCGARCRTMLNRAEQNAKRYVRYLPRRCAGCGELFTPRRSDARTCPGSRYCRNVALWDRERAANIAARPFRACASCGADITAYRTDAEVCSPRCQGRVRKARNRERYAVHQQARTARQRTAQTGCGVPLAEWRRILHRARGRCFYCDRLAPLTMEHVIPLVRGGKHSIGNVVAACGPCNSSKNDFLLVEWRYAR